MDEMTLALLGSLVEIRVELGQAVYEGAVERARIAVAAEVLVEAERRALKQRTRRSSSAEGHVITLGVRSGPRRGEEP